MRTRNKYKDAITSKRQREICEACKQSKLCHLYATYVGAAFVCDDCRSGKTKKK